MAHSQQNINGEYDPTVWVPEQHSHGTKDIWNRFWILAFVTILDIVVYFLPGIPTMAKILFFIVAGICKAYFIIGTFMHFKHERKGMRVAIGVPLFFIIFFIIWMMYEGSFWSIFN